MVKALYSIDDPKKRGLTRIDEFEGIEIFIYNVNEHSRPHFHAEYSGYRVKVDIETLEPQGKFPPKQMKKIRDFVTNEVKQDYLKIWEDKTGLCKRR